LGVGAIIVVGICIVGLGVSSCGGSDSSSPASTPSASQAVDSIDLGTLIEAEDAAIYAYGVIGAHLTGSAQDRAVSALQAHRRLRDAWIQMAQDANQEIPPAAIAYDLPIDARDSASARALAAEIETRLIAVYQSAGDAAADALKKSRARLALLTPGS
jgi:hypothetical protein